MSHVYLPLVQLVLLLFLHAVVVVVVMRPDKVDCRGHHHQRGDQVGKLVLSIMAVCLEFLVIIMNKRAKCPQKLPIIFAFGRINRAIDVPE